MLIKDLPNDLKKLVYRNQQIQGNFYKFNGDLSHGKNTGNFDWKNSLEGADFWLNVFHGRLYEIPPPKEIDYDLY